MGSKSMAGAYGQAIYVSAFHDQQATGICKGILEMHWQHIKICSFLIGSVMQAGVVLRSEHNYYLEGSESLS